MPSSYLSIERIDQSEGRNEFGMEFFGIYAEGFRKLTGPGVYIAMRGTGDDIEVLYIGSAKNILLRIAEPMHGSLRKAFEHGDCRMAVAICKSEKHARTLESELIRNYSPTLNIAGKSRQIG